MPVVFITSGTTFTIPSDFGSVVSIECIGGGAGGQSAAAQAGGGGAYSKVTTASGLTQGAVVTIQVGTGGGANTDGGDTWFNGASLVASSCGAKGGVSASGAGGASASGIGTTKFSGGAGGTGAGSNASGGGGAGGPLGVGGHGGTGASGGGGGGGGGNGGGSAGADVASGTGGNGGDNFGGTGHGVGGTPGTSGTNGGGGGGGNFPVNSGGNGGAGTEFDASHGSGGGGGGQGSTGGATNGSGALYGGGGAGQNGFTGGSGGQGIIVFTYSLPLPFGRTAVLSAILALSGPSAWPYTMAGGRQPYSGPMSTASFFIAPPVNDPPYSFAGRSPAQIAVEVQQYQPPVWPYTFGGNAQPYMGHRLNPVSMAVPVNDPPFDQRFDSNYATAIVAWRPDPWPPIFMGGAQAYALRRLPTVVTDVAVNDPPFTSQGRKASTASVIATLQPDPWVYSYMGGKAPYLTAKLSPGIPGQSSDNPPFSTAGRLPQTISTIWNWLPPVWPYTFTGALQPYQKGNLSPVIISVPLTINYRLTVRNVIVSYTTVAGQPWPGTSYPPKNTA